MNKLRTNISCEQSSSECTELMNGEQVVVYDVFAGVGPFAIPAGRMKCQVFANDLNPVSYEWLLFNLKEASSKKHPLHENVKCFNMDGRQFIHEVR